MAEWKSERSRTWNCLLYPENQEHMEALDRIRSSEDFDWVSVLHDCDSNENGELKKAHYHLILKFKNPIENYALAKKLGIKVNYLERTKSWKDSAKYLLHTGCPDKFQYTTDKLDGPLTDKVLRLLQPQEEGSAVLQISEMIEKTNGYLSTSGLVRMVCEAGLWSHYRRAQNTFSNILREHNSYYASSFEKGVPSDV